MCILGSESFCTRALSIEEALISVKDSGLSVERLTDHHGVVGLV
jgi:hypothetical protein